MASPIGILGAGTIGRSWATRFLAHGRRVRIFDARPDVENEVRRFVRDNAVNVAGGGDLREQGAMTFERSLAACVEGCSFVQESGPEDVATKTRMIADAAAASSSDTVIDRRCAWSEGTR